MLSEEFMLRTLKLLYDGSGGGIRFKLDAEKFRRKFGLNGHREFVTELRRLKGLYLLATLVDIRYAAIRRRDGSVRHVYYCQTFGRRKIEDIYERDYTGYYRELRHYYKGNKKLFPIGIDEKPKLILEPLS